MSVNVIIVLETNQQLTLKANPNTPLSQILEQACSKKNLNAAEYALSTTKGKELDLSLSFRLNGCVSGQKFRLKRRKFDAMNSEASVNIALQLPNGERLQRLFPVSTTLWELIRYWESNKSYNLTEMYKMSPTSSKIKEIFSKKSSTPHREGYFQPCIVFLNQEVNTNSSLKSTTLQKLGLVSGNGLLRLFHRIVPLEASSQTASNDFLKNIDPSSDMKELETNQTINPVIFQSFSNNNNNNNNNMKMTASDSELNSNITESSDIPFHSVASSDNKPIEILPMKKIDQSETMNPLEKSITTTTTKTITTSTDTSSTDITNPLLTSTDTNVNIAMDSKEEKISTENSETNREQNRERKLLSPSEYFNPSESEDYPESFYDVSVDDLHYWMKSYQTDDVLKTKKIRDKEREAKRGNLYEKAIIRVRFPDRVELQGTFRANETTEDLLSFVREQLNNSQVLFHLYTSPPPKQLLRNATLESQQLLPAALVYFSLESGNEFISTKQLLKSDVWNLLEQKASADSRKAESKETIEVYSRTVPKWLQLGKSLKNKK